MSALKRPRWLIRAAKVLKLTYLAGPSSGQLTRQESVMRAESEG
jgi:hypothetical protein